MADAYAIHGFLKKVMPLRIIESIFSISVLAWIIGTSRFSVSSFYSTILLCVIFMPIVTMYAFAGGSRAAYYYAFIGCFIVIFGSSYILERVSAKKIIFLKGGFHMAIILATFFVFLFILQNLFSGSFSGVNFDLLDVYEFREDQEVLLYSGIWAYATNWVIKVFSILLMILSLYYKKYFIFLTIFFLQILFFGLTAHKSVALYGAVAVFTYFFTTKKYANLTILKMGLIALIIIFISTFLITSGNLIASFGLRRSLFVPAYLHYVYYEFFSTYGNIFWSNGFASVFFDYPYENPASNMIGNYMGNVGMSANSGFLSSGLMHAGLFGIILYSILLMIVLVYLDLVRKHLPLNVTIAISIGPMISVLTSSDLIVSMLTHGVAVLLLVLYLLNSPRRKVN